MRSSSVRRQRPADSTWSRWKLAALFSRAASRDVFDVRELLRRGGFDRARLRVAFVAYGGMNRRDWRTVSTRDVDLDTVEVARQLVPLLRADLAPARSELRAWTEKLVAECRDLLSVVLPLEAGELQFLERLNDRGEIAPDLLTGERALQEAIVSHPALLWKAMNVRDHRALGPKLPAGPDP